MKSSVTSLDTVVTFDGSTSTLEQSSKDNDAGIEFNESGNSSRHLETTKDKSPPLDHSLVKRTPLGNKSPGTSRFSADKLCEQAKNRFRRSCTTKQLYRRLPFLQWIPKYTFDSAFYDCMAGVTVALTAIPQGIAYGAVAGVPVEYGLYTAFAGPMVYALLGSVSHVTVGPTAVMALMAYEYVQKGGPGYAVLLSFLAGCIQLIAGLLNLGFIMDFISGPVISGFCSAAATTVIFSQIKLVLGLKFRGSAFAKVIPGIFANWQDIKLWDTLLGILFIVSLMLLKNLTLMKKWFKDTTCCLHNPRVDKFLWFISTCRNALALFIGCLLTYILDIYGYRPFDLTGDIKSGLPDFRIPPFTFNRPAEGSSQNQGYNATFATENETVSFDMALKEFGAGLVLVPVIAILEQVAIAKAFSNGAKTDSTQEMIALGAGSIFCSFFGCIPLTASFARSSVLRSSGGRTQFASFYNGGAVLLALAFLMPTFYFIPKTVLGAVIITAVYPLIEYHEIIPMWKGRRIELIPFSATYFCCLLINIEYGILIGAQLHLLLLAYEATRPKTEIHYKEADEDCIVLQADRNLYFPSVERFRNSLTKASSDSAVGKTLEIDMKQVTQVDFTSLKMLKSMLITWNKNQQKYHFVNLKKKVEAALLAVLPANLVVVKADHRIME